MGVSLKEKQRFHRAGTVTNSRPGAHIRKFIPVYLMMLPGIIYLIINNYLPMSGIVIAFKQYNVRDGFFGSPWNGFSNFKYLFTTNDAFIITRNTILYNLAFIIINITLGILLAILICDTMNKHLKKMFQSAILLPFLMSWVIVGYIVYAFLSNENGIMNNSVLPMLGRSPVAWYNTPEAWPFIIILVNTWKGIGYGTLIYISTINGIDPTYYEAARMDGAKRWQQIRHITLPFLIPSVVTLTLLSVGRIMNADFGLFYQVTRNSGMLYSTTNVIDTYVYRGLMVNANLGRASAAGAYQSLIGFFLIILVNWLVRRFSNEHALF